MASNKGLAKSLGRYSIGLVLSVVWFPSFASAQALIENSAYRGMACQPIARRPPPLAFRFWSLATSPAFGCTRIIPSLPPWCSRPVD